MPDISVLDIPPDGKLVRNIVHFARALNRAGVPIGSGRVADAVRAVEAAGFTDRADFYWTLHACFVSRPEHRAIFAQIFRLYWRDPRFLEQMMSMMLPMVRGTQEERKARAAERRAAEALLDGRGPEPPAEEEEPEEVEIEIDASQTASAQEKLRSLDFEQMSVDEMAAARRILATLDLPVRPIATRRLVGAPRGDRVDWRGTIRRSLRTGGDIRDIARRKRRTRMPNLVVLCDISGSMSHYSRAVLHFVHSVANRRGQGWARVHAFTIGTRLTNITRHLATRDVDAALAAAGQEARDWEGGTRLGACLTAFNRDWSRRVMGQGAVVLLITDGLERDVDSGLSAAMERLSLSAREVIWLNPLLRFDGFAPRAEGIRAILPHVDQLRAGHNIAALEGLAQALADPRGSGEKARMMAML
ncbi:vWA domain-containing protein [Pelagovum pacificum]|uniref:VWA domain-containing protein n=1 Tax=Pelagovum pacificum TaxID=2588711 RepID=A0A5C5GCM5_9RHOB|nr:VWA domain-containing protein [Pelagovum pacificum]QQA44401.1 VWA domain-containing protein [Pelagovum pacificum]TNY32483.1 VWA domain-containing protein [Pelagovum pacificum]